MFEILYSQALFYILGKEYREIRIDPVSESLFCKVENDPWTTVTRRGLAQPQHKIRGRGTEKGSFSIASCPGVLNSISDVDETSKHRSKCFNEIFRVLLAHSEERFSGLDRKFLQASWTYTFPALLFGPRG